MSRPGGQGADDLDGGCEVHGDPNGDLGEVLGGPGDQFGIGAVIPSLQTTFRLTDVNSGAQTLVQGKSAQDAANRALATVYPGAVAVVRLPGTTTFQTDKGNTFRLEVSP